MLASTSPQRRAILEQLGIAFDVVAPDYEEHDPPGLSPAEAVRAHAAGKARSVIAEAAGRQVLGVDTAVVLDGAIYGKPADAAEACSMLAALAGRAHEVVSGPVPRERRTGGRRARDDPRDVPAAAALPRSTTYVATGEWEGRAGGYAIQGRGAALVERIDGDYLNVVGLPGALLRPPAGPAVRRT